jgi:Chaperone of endosialidase
MSTNTRMPRGSRKRPYTPPKLTRYGDVRALTQSGTMGMNEPPNIMTRLMPSDRASKENIVRIGMHPLGIGLYLFDYKPEFRDRYGHTRQFGVMADEVEKVLPGAVSVHPRGYKMVDYAMLGVRRSAR